MSLFDRRERPLKSPDLLKPDTPKIIDTTHCPEILITNPSVAGDPDLRSSTSTKILLPPEHSPEIAISIQPAIDGPYQITNQGHQTVHFCPDLQKPEEYLALEPKQQYLLVTQTPPSLSFRWQDQQGRPIQLDYIEELNIAAETNDATIAYSQIEPEPQAVAA